VRRKAILLASVTGAALIALGPAYAEGFYVGVLGGANFVQSQDGSFTTDFRLTNTFHAHFDPDTGFLLGSVVGLELDRWLHGFRVELEASYRRNDVGGRWDVTSVNNLAIPGEIGAAALATGPISANMSTFALMANAWYEFSVGSRFKPYLGGGFGWARSRLDGEFEEPNISLTAQAVNPFNGFVVENSGFAYQLGFGITSEISPGVSLGIGYRYFDAPNTEIFFAGKLIGSGVTAAASSNNSIKFDNVSHSVALTFSVDIN
jgi:opacity protein-like surface antigen